MFFAYFLAGLGFVAVLVTVAFLINRRRVIPSPSSPIQSGTGTSNPAGTTPAPAGTPPANTTPPAGTPPPVLVVSPTDTTKRWWRVTFSGWSLIKVMVTVTMLGVLFAILLRLNDSTPLSRTTPALIPSLWRQLRENHDLWQIAFFIAGIAILLSVLFRGVKKNFKWVPVGLVVLLIGLYGPGRLWQEVVGSWPSDIVSTTTQFTNVRFNPNERVLPLTMRPSQTAVALWPGSMGTRYASFCLVRDAAATAALNSSGHYGQARFIQGAEGRVEWTPSTAVKDYFTRLGQPIELRVHLRQDTQRQC